MRAVVASRSTNSEQQVLLVGTDAHTAAVCHQVTDRFRKLRLVELPAASLLDLLNKESQSVVAIVLDDSVENFLDLLSAVTEHTPEVAVIAVTPRCEPEYAAEIMRRNALIALLKPCTFDDLNRWIVPLLLARMQGDAKIKRPTTAEFPQYCARCNIELSRTYMKELREEMTEKGTEKPASVNEGFLTLAEVERRHICQTVARLGNDNLEAARVLGMGKSTLYRKLKEYGSAR